MPAIVTRHWERSTGIEHGNRLGSAQSAPPRLHPGDRPRALLSPLQRGNPRD